MYRWSWHSHYCIARLSLREVLLWLPWRLSQKVALTTSGRSEFRGHIQRYFLFPGTVIFLLSYHPFTSFFPFSFQPLSKCLANSLQRLVFKEREREILTMTAILILLHAPVNMSECCWVTFLFLFLVLAILVGNRNRIILCWMLTCCVTIVTPPASYGHHMLMEVFTKLDLA